MWRVLRPGGTLFLTCDAGEVGRPWRVLLRRVPRGPTLDELRREAEVAQFDVERLRRYGLRDLKDAQGSADGRARMLTLELEEALEPAPSRLWGLLYLRANAGSA